MTEEKGNQETVAFSIIKTANRCRIIHAIVGGSLALSLIAWGYFLTQRQFFFPQNDQQSEIVMKAKEVEFKTKSTYPGLILIVCGTFIACATLLKRYRAKTQHKDPNNNIPGFTEVES